MQRFSVRRQQQGFTLIEMIVTVIIVGVLGAVTIPSLLGLLNQTKVNDGLRQIQTSLKEAQRQAMRRGASCIVRVNATNNTITGDPVQCLSSSRTVDDNLEFKGNVASGGAATASNIEIEFSRKGSNAGAARTIAVYRDGVTGGVQKCVIVAQNLGGIKSGIYTGNVSSDITQGSCDVSVD